MCAQHLYLVTLLVFREHLLRYLRMVLADKAACCLNYGLGGAVVLFQFEQFRIRIEL